jgi:hypothetical protein
MPTLLSASGPVHVRVRLLPRAHIAMSAHLLPVFFNFQVPSKLVESPDAEQTKPHDPKAVGVV